MIFAAGLGTRLRPLTNDRPKALVGLAGRPLLEHVIHKMLAAGIGRIVVNVHHYAGQIEAFLESRGYFGGKVVVSDERERLLDTGGGLWQARKWIVPGEGVLIHNVDILSEVDLGALMARHAGQGNDATLVVRRGVPGRGLRFDESGALKGWENSLTGEQKPVDAAFERAQPYAFCGIQVVSAALWENMIHRGVFSIIDEYLSQAAVRAVKMYFYEGPFMDLGTPEAVAEAERYLAAAGR